MCSWKRPPGPLNVWKVVEGFETLEDGTKNPVKFSIQDIPNDENRRKEVFDHLYTYYLADEPLSKVANMKEDSNGVQDYFSVVKYGLDQGEGVGCYILNFDGSIGKLIGVNTLYIMNDKTAEDIEKIKNSFKSLSYKKIWEFDENLARLADITKIYKVNSYIASTSLSVDPAYRGQKLGVHILGARENIGKKYGIPATCSAFSGVPSQLQAERAGFEECVTLKHADVVDEEGNPEFPNIESECSRLMMKKFF